MTGSAGAPGTEASANAPSAAASGVTIISAQLGSITVPQEAVVEFPHGVLGFSAKQTFCLVQVKPGSRFQLMQSCTREDLAFVVVDPLQVAPDYDLEAVRIQAGALLGADDLMGVACIVTVRPAPERPTVNLAAPIVINIGSRQGRQVLLADGRFHIRHAI